MIQNLRITPAGLALLKKAGSIQTPAPAPEVTPAAPKVRAPRVRRPGPLLEGVRARGRYRRINHPKALWLRLSVEEHEQVKAAAAAACLRPSYWARNVLVKAAKCGLGLSAAEP